MLMGFVGILEQNDEPVLRVWVVLNLIRDGNNNVGAFFLAEVPSEGMVRPLTRCPLTRCVMVCNAFRCLWYPTTLLKPQI